MEPSTQPAAPRRSRIYYGWYLVAAVNGSIPIFLWPMREEFGFGSLAFVGVFSVGVLASGLTQPILGHLFDRSDSRRVIWISVMVAGFATVGLVFISHYWHLVLLFGVVFSSAMGGASFGILGPLAARWFLKRRALVLSLLMAIPSMAGIFSPSFSGLVVVYYSWREALMALGAVLLFLALPLGLKFLRNWPSDMGRKPDGGLETPMEVRMRGGAPALQRGRFEVERWWRAFRSPPMWALVPVFAMGGFAEITASLVFQSFAVDSLNLGSEFIAVCHGVMAVLGPAGVLAVGLAADRFARKKVLGALLLVQGLALLVLIAVPFGFALLLFAVLAGLSGTAWLVIAFSLIADIYGLRALATLWGIAFLFHSIGSFVGRFSVLLAIGLAGSYHLFFAALASMLVLASVASFAINEGKYSARYQAALEVEAAGN